MTYYNYGGYGYGGYGYSSYSKYGYSSYSYSKYYGYSYCKPYTPPPMTETEITAFRESDLVSGNLGCGSTFTMPGAATVCMTISDDDSKLSGDCYDRATDSTGQTATIEVDGKEIGNGGQVYAEVYHVLKDNAGNKYILIEIEQEGSNSDFFTFYTGNGYTIPAAGTQLKVVSTCNLSGVSLKDLGAGPKEMPNEDPTAQNDAAMTCEDDAVKIDVLSNDSDADGGSLSITSVAGQAIAEGETVTLANGVEVMLMNGQLQVSGANAANVQALVPGQELTVSFDYGVSDGQGGSATATVDVTFCGSWESVAEFAGSLPSGQISYTIIDTNNPSGASDEAYTVTFAGTGDARLDGVSFAEAYCLNIRLDDGSPSVDLTGTMALVDDSSFASRMGIAADQMDNVVNYLLNTDWAAQGYTDAEVQGAIWGLFNNSFFVTPDAGEQADARAILDDAKANGTDFEVAPGGLVGVVVTPDDASYQPFVIGLEYTDCIC